MGDDRLHRGGVVERSHFTTDRARATKSICPNKRDWMPRARFITSESIPLHPTLDTDEKDEETKRQAGACFIRCARPLLIRIVTSRRASTRLSTASPSREKTTYTNIPDR
jgi:hypothetical protein